MSAAPWSDLWPDRLATGPHYEHVLLRAVRGALPGPVDLPCTRLVIDADESFVPRWKMQATIPTPTDETLVGQLDPRAGVYLEAQVGYSTPTVAPDVHRLAFLGLRTRTANRPDGTTDLTCAGAEATVDDGVVGQTEDAALDRSGVTEFTESVLGYALGTGTTVVESEYPAGFHPDLVEEPFGVYARPTPRLTSMLDPIDGEVFAGPDGVWTMRHRPTVADTPLVTFRTGPGGIVERVQADTSRETPDGWANSVVVVNEWSAYGTVPAGRVTGVARVTDGPYAYANGRAITTVINRDFRTSATAVGDAAASILRKLFTKGRRLQITCPVIPWLRPGDTVAFGDPGQPADRYLINKLSMTWPGSTMTLTLRRPETGTITIGE